MSATAPTTRQGPTSSVAMRVAPGSTAARHTHAGELITLVSQSASTSAAGVTAYGERPSRRARSAGSA
jgi:hypothetical protein